MKLASLSSAVRRSFGLVRTTTKWGLLLLVVLVTLSSVALGVELFLVREIVDRFTSETPATLLLVAFSIATASRRFAGVVANEYEWLIRERVDKKVVEGVLQVAVESRYEDFEQPEFQDSIARALKAGQRDVWAASGGLLMLLRSVTQLITLAVVLATVAPQLLPPFVGVGLALGGFATVKSKMSYGFEHHDTGDDRERRYLRDALVSRSEGREMRLFGSSKVLQQRHAELHSLRIAKLQALLSRRLVIDLGGALVLAAVLSGCLLLIGELIESGSITLANAAVAAVSANQMASSLSGLSNGIGSVMQSAQHVGDLESFLERETQRGVAYSTNPQAIELRDATYRYPGAERNAVSNLDLKVEVGQMVAIVGENGSGKSTVARLLLGLYQPSSGEALLVDDEGKEQSVDGPLVGVATATFQDFAKYELTFVENLLVGAMDMADHTQIERALDQARLRDVLNNLPGESQTRLGRRFTNGQDLSLGQWQRLAYARSMIESDASFVVLDEPTASLDAKMSSVLFSELRSSFDGLGIVLISHTLSSLSEADRIIVMSEGSVVEDGTHDELVDRGGLYGAMLANQVARLGMQD